MKRVSLWDVPGLIGMFGLSFGLTSWAILYAPTLGLIAAWIVVFFALTFIKLPVVLD